jgi:hypothetical protein
VGQQHDAEELGSHFFSSSMVGRGKESLEEERLTREPEKLLSPLRAAVQMAMLKDYFSVWFGAVSLG